MISNRIQIEHANRKLKMSRKWKRWYWLTLLPLHRHSLPRKRVSKFVCLKGRIAPPRTRCVWSSVICTAISEIKLRVLTKVRYRSAPRCRKRRRQVTETRHGTRNTATDQRLRQKCWENVQKTNVKKNDTQKRSDAAPRRRKIEQQMTQTGREESEKNV